MNEEIDAHLCGPATAVLLQHESYATDGDGDHGYDRSRNGDARAREDDDEDDEDVW